MDEPPLPIVLGTVLVGTGAGVVLVVVIGAPVVVEGAPVVVEGAPVVAGAPVGANTNFVNSE